MGVSDLEVTLSGRKLDKVRYSDWELDGIEVEVDPDDLRVETYRANVASPFDPPNSRVRLSHAPSGLVVMCASEDSHRANKERAMKVLKYHLHKLG